LTLLVSQPSQKKKRNIIAPFFLIPVHHRYDQVCGRDVKTVDLFQSWEQVSSTPYRTSGLAQCLLACTPRHVLTRVRRRVRRSDARPVGSQGRVRLCSVRAHTVRMRCAAGKLPLVVVEAECGCLARTGEHLHGHGQAGRYQPRIYCAPTAALLQEPVASEFNQQS